MRRFICCFRAVGLLLHGCLSTAFGNVGICLSHSVLRSWQQGGGLFLQRVGIMFGAINKTYLKKTAWNSY